VRYLFKGKSSRFASLIILKFINDVIFSRHKKKTFSLQTNVRKHKIAVHDKIRPHKCDVCGKVLLFTLIFLCDSDDNLFSRHLPILTINQDMKELILVRNHSVAIFAPR